jgi:hypothetical protein
MVREAFTLASQGTEMHERTAPNSEGIPEAEACFVLVIQGSTTWAGVVRGIDGVKETLVQLLWKDPERAMLEEVAAILAALEEPVTWEAHGSGDGRPYWHWWFGYEGGSVTVQRLTEPLPSDLAMDRLRSSLGEVTGVLDDCAGDLRKLAGLGEKDYVFARRHSGQGSS